MAYRLQERAAGVGFDWPDTGGPLDKVREELAEVEAELSVGEPKATRHSPTRSATCSSRWSTSPARPACSPGPPSTGPTRKFRRRFEAIEAMAAERGIDDAQRARLEVLDGLWDEVKQRENGETVNGER